MSTLRLFCALAALLLVTAACTAPDDGNDPGVSDDDDDDGATPTPTPGWVPIITADWSLAPYSEDTSDLHVVTLDRDYYVGKIRPIAPPGTHHTLLMLGASSADIIYASGLGTGELTFPPGVALKLPAGQTLALQLHLFNVDAGTLTGTSGIEIFEMAPEDVVDEADLFLPGPFAITLPPSAVTSMVDTCNIATSMNVFAMIPHMHQLGTHFRTAVTAQGVTTTVHDEAYDFSNQSVTAFAPIALTSGDSIEIECTWNNTTGSPVGWGESSTTEMCFSIMYAWPAVPTDFCTQNP